jgi:hypothetical protein
VKQQGVSVSRLLDFGSGLGNSIPYFRRFFPTADLTRADISQRSLEVSQSCFPDSGNLAVIESDCVPRLCAINVFFAETWKISSHYKGCEINDIQLGPEPVGIINAVPDQTGATGKN